MLPIANSKPYVSLKHTLLFAWCSCSVAWFKIQSNNSWVHILYWNLRAEKYQSNNSIHSWNNFFFLWVFISQLDGFSKIKRLNANIQQYVVVYIY